MPALFGILSSTHVRYQKSSLALGRDLSKPSSTLMENRFGVIKRFDLKRSVVMSKSNFRLYHRLLSLYLITYGLCETLEQAKFI